MKPWQLIQKEICYRKTGFGIGLLCVAIAIASLTGALTLLRVYETRTSEILEERERETRAEMDRLENDYRRIMRDLGHNVMILHEDQSRSALRTVGHPDTFMPADYVYQLGHGGIETLNHLLPVLQQRVTWPEQEMDVILMGTPGQVPVFHLTRFLTEDGESYRNPIFRAIPEGKIEIGHAIATDLGLRPGDTITLMGESFEVHRVNRAQGSEEDIMLWCNLDVAQRWLDREDQINIIFALECICDIEGLGAITDEISAILPDVQVLEFSSRVIARGEARQRAEQESRRAIAAELAHRTQMSDELRGFATILVPVVLAASGLWIFFLILGNVRERESEIGILRAIGVKESVIAGIFLGKAIGMGLVGALIGYVAGVLAGALGGGGVAHGSVWGQFNLTLLAVALLVAVVLCAAAGWVPAMLAAQRDPADMLRGD